MQPYLGQTIPLYVDRTTSLDTPGAEVEIPGNFKLVVCLTSTGISMTNSSVDVSSFCSGIYDDSIPNKVGATISGAGLQETLDEVDTDVLNHNDLMDMINNQTVAWFALYNDDYSTVRYVKGYLTSYQEDNPNADKSTFTLSVVAKGEVFTAVAT